MKFRALRPLRGDYGPGGTPANVQPGEVFEVPEHYAKRLAHLERRGTIVRHLDRPKINRAAYTVYQPKAVAPPENKMLVVEENKTPATPAQPITDGKRLRKWQRRHAS